jgi:translation elongation factor EF-Tu-like GTPase
MFEFTASSTLDGSKRYVLSGYRPNYRVTPDYRTTTIHRFVDTERVNTGERVKAEVWFITPEHYPNALWEGQRIEVGEGGTIVGYATVLKVHNPLLLRSPGDNKL